MPPRRPTRTAQRARWLSRRARTRVTAGLVVAGLVAAAVLTATWWSDRTGELAPDFALPATTGETVRLADYRGRHPVVLVFYMAGT